MILCLAVFIFSGIVFVAVEIDGIIGRLINNNWLLHFGFNTLNANDGIGGVLHLLRRSARLEWESIRIDSARSPLVRFCGACKMKS